MAVVVAAGARRRLVSGRWHGGSATVTAGQQALLRRAVAYSALPGVHRQQVCDRFGLSRRALLAARKAWPEITRLSRSQLVLAALTRSGERSEGSVGDLAAIAGFVDWQNHDGTTAAEVSVLLDELMAQGQLAIAQGNWRLLQPWP